MDSIISEPQLNSLPPRSFTHHISRHYTNQFEHFSASTAWLSMEFLNADLEKHFRSYTNNYYGAENRRSMLLLIATYLSIALINNTFALATWSMIFVISGLLIMVAIFIIASTHILDDESRHIFKYRYQQLCHGIIVCNLLLLISLQYALGGNLTTDRFIIYYLSSVFALLSFLI